MQIYMYLDGRGFPSASILVIKRFDASSKDLRASRGGRTMTFDPDKGSGKVQVQAFEGARDKRHFQYAGSWVSARSIANHGLLSAPAQEHY